jgi:citrate synthase
MAPPASSQLDEPFEPFTISESHLNTGLRGFPVGTCRTSAVSPEHGVSYAGYPIAELADLPCEHAIYLMFHGELPTEGQARAFAADLARRSTIPAEVVAILRSLPRSGHPMEWLVVGIQLVGMTGKTRDNDYREDAWNLVARTSGLVAAITRLRLGWGDPIPARHDLPFHENFAHQLGVPGAHPHLADFLRLFYILHLDHDGGNLSTFTGKAIASGHADLYSAIGGAMAALYGPLHGRANQECLRIVREVGTSDREAVAAFVRRRLAEGGVIFGFGHPVLRAEDPRARIQYEYAALHFAGDPLVQTALALREVVPPILKENAKIRDPYPNVDAISGSILNAAGLTDPELYTMLFGWSRACGISAQIVDERCVLRDGKGVPIYRPRFIPEGQPPRHRAR